MLKALERLNSSWLETSIVRIVRIVIVRKLCLSLLANLWWLWQAGIGFGFSFGFSFVFQRFKAVESSLVETVCWRIARKEWIVVRLRRGIGFVGLRLWAKVQFGWGRKQLVLSVFFIIECISILSRSVLRTGFILGPTLTLSEIVLGGRLIEQWVCLQEI
jgi:hypothetical protein